jgi:hypothetical protein
VVISCGAEVIARHPRSYERADFVFEPLLPRGNQGENRPAIRMRMEPGLV